ncbi:hypothetical protein KFL_000530185 [Klebsormidium nitens]|uniref:F-box domain-containing protein n=1 Tax=Klebsormidium nitens TaxID=105231 RepID=A0A1Y1HTR3_KLENI|nr:hypothetical protein KFL_000530185 [Klebsormidium nitens]|eukprot:GAQ80391.1 hypothetical protein KFL_000530185 [Klebsormidium nitens]
MDRLDAPLVDHLLTLLGPAGACRVAVLSKDHKELVETNSLWKTWCERESPSLTTSPAKEYVEAFYGNRASYKKLFAKLSRERSGASVKWNLNKDAAVGKNRGSKLSDYVMLMDVYLRGESFVFCSAECSELEVAGYQDDWMFQNGYYFDCEGVCKAVVRAFVNPPGLKEDVSSAVKHVASLDEQQVSRWPKPERQEVLLFSWKLMRKSDGKIQNLLDHEPMSLSHRTFLLHPEYRFEALAPVRDPENLDWTLFKALMRLRSYREEQKAVQWDGWTSNPPQKQEEYAVEVGISKDCFARECREDPNTGKRSASRTLQ